MAIYGAAAAKRAGARHIITMHGGLYYATAWRRRLALRWAARRSEALVGVSAATAGTLERTLAVPHDHIFVVPNGIPQRSGGRERVRRGLGIPDDELLIVAVGNLYPVKGHVVLLDALAMLGDDARWHLAIAGRGEEEARLRSQSSAAGLDARVHILGFRDDIPDILAAGDIFAMPSLSEGLPLALVEAMSFGLPVVVSRVGGIPEVVSENVEALLVTPSDALALSVALRSLLDDAQLRARLGDAGRTRARRDYAIATMADRYERLYRGEPLT
jgi:glycosyltransferase involved in cell wall biosynthesis